MRSKLHSMLEGEKWYGGKKKQGEGNWVFDRKRSFTLKQYGQGGSQCQDGVQTKTKGVAQQKQLCQVLYKGMILMFN